MIRSRSTKQALQHWIFHFFVIRLGLGRHQAGLLRTIFHYRTVEPFFSDIFWFYIFPWKEKIKVFQTDSQDPRIHRPLDIGRRDTRASYYMRYPPKPVRNFWKYFGLPRVCPRILIIFESWSGPWSPASN